MDFESQITLIYCICDDCVSYLGIKDDPQCKMSTAEVMTLAIASAKFFYGNFKRTRLILKEGKYVRYFLSESQLNRRWHAIDHHLWSIVLYILSKANLALRLPSKYYAIDSFPVPVCQRGRSYCNKLYKGKSYLGYCKSKRLHYYGLKVHLVVSEHGIICEFYITPASKSDVKSLEEHQLLLEPGSILLGDKAYTSYGLEALLQEKEAITLLPLRKKNLRKQYSPTQKHMIKSTRKIVETAISCVQGMFPKAIVARTSRGFELKLLMFLLAKSCQDYITAS